MTEKRALQLWHPPQGWPKDEGNVTEGNVSLDNSVVKRY